MPGGCFLLLDNFILFLSADVYLLNVEYLECESCLLLIEIGDKPIAHLAAPVIFLLGSTHLYIFNKLKGSRKGSWFRFAALPVPQEKQQSWKSEL